MENIVIWCIFSSRQKRVHVVLFVLICHIHHFSTISWSGLVVGVFNWYMYKSNTPRVQSCTSSSKNCFYWRRIDDRLPQPLDHHIPPCHLENSLTKCDQYFNSIETRKNSQWSICLCHLHKAFRRWIEVVWF